MEHLISDSASYRALPPAAAMDAVQGLAGSWKLGAGQALSLRPHHPGELRITHGRVWLTFGQAGLDLRVRAGDHFLSRGDRIPLLAGDSVVLEPVGISHASSAYFSWDPATASSPVLALQPAGRVPGVLQPLLNLRAALGLAGAALGRPARRTAGIGGLPIRNKLRIVEFLRFTPRFIADACRPPTETPCPKLSLRSPI